MKNKLLLRRRAVLCASIACLLNGVMVMPAMSAAIPAKFIFAPVRQESGTITGKVLDETGQPLPGASI